MDDTSLANLPELSHRLLSWFFQNKRELPWREESDPYRILVSEIMLQQTRSQTVASYYLRWLERFSDLPTLAKAGEEEVLKAWEGLGYYSRARHLHQAAQVILERWGGRFPTRLEELKSLPGIGEYTAAAILSIASAKKIGAVDGNVTRVVSRLLADPSKQASAAFRRRVRAIIEASFLDYHPGWVNQAWMELGALVCRPVPRCPSCPLSHACLAYRKRRVRELPGCRSAAPLPVRRGILFLLLRYPFPASPQELAGNADAQRIGDLLKQTAAPLLLVKRPSRGLLGGLWEFPNFPGRDGKLEPFLTACGIDLLTPLDMEVCHRYSHFEVRFQPCLAALRGELPAEPPPPWVEQRWVTPSDLGLFPRPKVHIKTMHLFGLSG